MLRLVFLHDSEASRNDAIVARVFHAGVARIRLLFLNLVL